MRFVGKQPREGINVSKTHPLAEAGLLIVGLGLLFVTIAVVLVFAVEIALRYVSVEQESALFRNWLPDDLVTVAPDDERLVAVQNLVDRLARRWPDSPYEFRVEIDASEVANAMALPGGLIIVTEGLLREVQSENELAFVLGHELGHFHNRDHLRALGRGIVLLLSYTVATGGDVGGVGLAATDLTIRGFNRKQETRADEFGLSLVHLEYGHVQGAWRVFERWHDDDSRGASVTYLSTHPNPGDRVLHLLEFAQTREWQLDGTVRTLAW